METFDPGSTLQDNLLMLRSDTPFDSFTFSEPRTWLVNTLVIEAGEAEASAPTPATLVLLGLGIAGIGYQRRKQIKTG